MSHVDEGTLHAYLDGELTDGEREDVAVHVAECAGCRARLEEERALAARARDVLALATPPTSTRSRARRARVWPRVRLPLAWAATVMIAFATGRYLQQTPAPGPAVPAVSGPLPPVVAQPPSAGSRPVAMRRETRRSEQRTAPEPLADSIATVARFDADSARAVLGQAPALVPGARLAAVTRGADGGVIVEQQLEAGTVIRLYERRAAIEPAGAAAPEAAAPERERAARRPTPALAAAPRAAAPPAGERLARYLGMLRIEIAGPLSPDSLSRLLERVR